MEMTNNTTKFFKTANYRLEQFLYCHDIAFKTWRKNADMMTEWIYEITPELVTTVNEFKEIQKRRAARKEMLA